ncbi:hypothetical protein Ahy_A07g034277 [Arachis hypogaea]|uniref:Protein FAR1-RELATED SEQUENCE n=1 Tax=Arachis hypogaea TaxID=3818 RepID=A0A445CBD2_ARAHY|nr:hypothetical protein Ahy_A07g034277 [Arachis hypogaea]
MLVFGSFQRQLSIFVQRIIKNNEKAEIRPRKTYQLFVAAIWGHHELTFIEKDVRNYIMREVRNYGVRDNKRLSKSRERESDTADVHTIIPCAIKFSIKAQISMCILTRSSGKSKHNLEKIFERVNKVLPRYILEQWNNNVKRRHTHIKRSHNEPLLESRSRRFDNLVCRSQNICEFASQSEELTEILHLAYDNAMVEMQEYKAKKRKMSLSHDDASLEDINKFQNPPRLRTRGRPKNRLETNTEKQIANAAKKKESKALSEYIDNSIHQLSPAISSHILHNFI